MSLRHFVVDKNLLILAPQSHHLVRPVVHVGGFKGNFGQFGNLLALLNGTFFGDPAPGPNMFGDHLTDSNLAWGFTPEPVEIQQVNGRDVYFRSASQVAKPGYSKRWGLGGLPNGKVSLMQGQPSEFSALKSFEWFLGGGALLLKDGKKPAFPASSGDPLGLMSKAGGQFQSDVLRSTNRSLMLVDQEDRVHFAVGLNRTPEQLSQSAQGAGYRHALMLDGGGSTVLAYQAKSAGKRRELATTERQLQSFLGLFQNGVATEFMGLDDGWPILQEGCCGDLVTALQLWLRLLPTGCFDGATSKAVVTFRDSRGLSTGNTVDATVWSQLPNLRLKAKGPEVESCQFLLAYRHNLDLKKFGPSADGVDGSYGAAMSKAVLLFRDRIGLPALDEVGHDFWKAVLADQ